MARRVQRLGPLPFADYLELALYDSGAGFFATGGGAGRGGDFLTSPEVGPLFAAVLARALDHWWVELGEPDPFAVVEAGAGRGTLTRGVLDARPRCAPALRYVLVEPSAALRAAQAGSLALEPPALVLGPAGRGDDEVDEREWPTGSGPLVTSLAELPAQPFVGVVLANEMLDNLPFLLLERRGRSWDEVRVGYDGARLVEVAVPAAAPLADEGRRLAPDAPEGARVPLQHHAAAWVRRALSLVERGRIVVVDYADTTASLARRPWLDWVRTYRAHRRGSHPLEHPGDQDVTCEVAVDQLSAVRPPSSDRSQAAFLRANGLDELVGSARAEWGRRAHVGDLDALRALSRVHEGAALTDEVALGAFRVLEWVIDG